MHFVEIIRERVICEADILMSFSLFTKVPIDEIMGVVKEKPQSDASMEDRTPVHSVN